MKKLATKLVAMGLVLTSIAGTLTGCGTKASVQDLAMSPLKNSYDVYLENSHTGDYVLRTSTQIAYNYRTITDETLKSNVVNYVGKIEDSFAEPFNQRTALMMSESNYENFKYMLDRYSLQNGTVTSIRGIGDVIVADVEYTATRVPYQELPEGVDYVGLKGYYRQYDDGTWYVDKTFAAMSVLALNSNAVDNNIMKQYSLDEETGGIIIEDGEPRNIAIVLNSNNSFTNGDVQDTQAGFDLTDLIVVEQKEYDEEGNVIENTGDALGGETEEGTTTLPEEFFSGGTENSNSEITYEEYVEWIETLREDGIQTLVAYVEPVTYSLIPEDRHLRFDGAYIRNIIGIPVDAMPSGNTDLYGDYGYLLGGRGFLTNTGSQGLNLFEPSFAGSGATITMRYYMQYQNGALSLKTVLPTSIRSDANYSSLQVREMTTSKFVQDSIQTVLTRLDRCISNQDITGIMDGGIVIDKSYGALICFEKIGSVVSAQTTTLSKVLDYDEETSTYLIEATRTYKVGGVSEGCTGSYTELVYMAIYSSDDGMRIVDELPVELSMVSEPYIAMSSYTEQIASNLYTYTDAISDDVRKDIAQVFDEYYISCNNKLLTITKQETIDTYGTHIGMNDIYVQDDSLFNPGDRARYQERAQSNLLRAGTGIGCNVSYEIINFTGGSNNFVDVIVRETYVYDSAMNDLEEEIHYTLFLTEDGWRICGVDVLSSTNVVYSEADDTTEQTEE